MSWAAIAVLKKKFPKFGPSQMSMIKNPEYGLQLSSEAVSYLAGVGISLDNKNRPNSIKNISKAKKKRSKNNRLTVRLNDEDMERFRKIKQNNSTQAILEEIIKQYEERER